MKYLPEKFRLGLDLVENFPFLLWLIFAVVYEENCFGYEMFFHITRTVFLLFCVAIRFFSFCRLDQFITSSDRPGFLYGNSFSISRMSRWRA